MEMPNKELPAATRPEYIAYPKAMKLLAERLEATPEEMAAWLFFGPGTELGGLTAYLHANELDPPPQFHYNFGGDDFDYISPLMGCWFIAEEIANFQPIERYITGKTLIDRWGKQPSIQPKAYVLAKIRESRLADFHPICGGTEVSFSSATSAPPLEDGLFARSHVEAIEASDFGSDAAEDSAMTKEAPQQAVNAPHTAQPETKAKTPPQTSAAVEQVPPAADADTTPAKVKNLLVKWQIIAAFEGRHYTADQWRKYLASPPPWLVECRKAKGSKTASALWNPVEIAIALTDDKRAISVQKLDAVFVAHTFLKSWVEEWRKASDYLR